MANMMVTAYSDCETGLNGRRMAFPLTIKFRTPSIRAKQIAMTLRRNISRPRDSAVENANSTTSSVTRHAHKGVTTVMKVNGARMSWIKLVMIASWSVELAKWDIVYSRGRKGKKMDQTSWTVGLSGSRLLLLTP